MVDNLFTWRLVLNRTILIPLLQGFAQVCAPPAKGSPAPPRPGEPREHGRANEKLGEVCKGGTVRWNTLAPERRAKGFDVSFFLRQVGPRRGLRRGCADPRASHCKFSLIVSPANQEGNSTPHDRGKRSLPLSPKSILFTTAREIANTGFPFALIGP